MVIDPMGTEINSWQNAACPETEVLEPFFLALVMILEKRNFLIRAY